MGISGADGGHEPTSQELERLAAKLTHIEVADNAIERSANTSARRGSLSSSPPMQFRRTRARNQWLRDVTTDFRHPLASLGLPPRVRAWRLHARGWADPTATEEAMADRDHQADV